MGAVTVALPTREPWGQPGPSARASRLSLESRNPYLRTVTHSPILSYRQPTPIQGRLTRTEHWPARTGLCSETWTRWASRKGYSAKGVSGASGACGVAVANAPAGRCRPRSRGWDSDRGAVQRQSQPRPSQPPPPRTRFAGVPAEACGGFSGVPSAVLPA